MAAVAKELTMFFHVGIPCKGSWLFTVPHRTKPMKARHIARRYPKFAAEFDGSAEECCLAWYYKLNKAEGVFEFKDSDAEDEVAELLGVTLCSEEWIDENSTGSTARALTEEERAAVREHLADIRHGLDVLARSTL
jgi:hypothetical protein